MITKHQKHIRLLKTELQQNAHNQHDQDIISQIISYLSIYTLHKATIIRFGIRKIDNTNPWTITSRDFIDINTRINMLTKNTKQNLKKIKKLKQKYKIIIAQMHKQKAIKQTDKLTQKDKSQATRSMANMFKYHKQQQHNPHLTIINPETNTEEHITYHQAISDHLAQIFQTQTPSSN